MIGLRIACVAPKGVIMCVTPSRRDSELTNPYLVDGENVPTETQVADYEKVASQWNHNGYNCRNYILNALEDSLYDIYSTFAIAREIWESLEKKYRTQNSKSLSMKWKSKVGINFNFHVGSIIEKLPQSWKYFKLYLKHLTDDMSFEQLVLKIHVEEDNRMNEKADVNSLAPNANMVRESFSKSKSNHKNKSKNGGGSGQKHSKDGKKDYN
ncbi:hypothetical protein Tco_0785574 [Tanacetum coccineum]